MISGRGGLLVVIIYLFQSLGWLTNFVGAPDFTSTWYSQRQSGSLMMSALQHLLRYVSQDLHTLSSLELLVPKLAEFLLLYPAFMAFLWIGLGSCYVFLKEWRLPWRGDFKPTVAVVVPAHNEELVIGRTLDSLLAQDYPGLEIHVISDGSTDRTLEITRGYAPCGVIVHDLQMNRGKNGVLQYALGLIKTDLFLVVDADTQAAPNAVSCLVQQFADGRVGAVTGGIRVQNASTLLSALQSMEYAVIVSLAKRADQFWGGLYTVSGAAACFRTTALRAVGGWSSWTATEDIEVSWRMQKAGFHLAYEPRAIFHVQVPTSLRALYRQRTRWAQGMTEVFRLHGDLWQSRNSALLPIAAQGIATAIWMILICLLLLSLVWEALSGNLNFNSHFMSFSRGGLIATLNWTCGLFLLQTVVAALIEGSRGKQGYWVFGLALLYPLYYWAVIFPCFVAGAIRGLVTQRSEQWERTERTLAR
jgi:biofilm PGA synthesis N-glycosyltransferase PgaC